MTWFLRLVLSKGVVGICLAPFGIYLREHRINDERLINHERIHWSQQMEMFIVFFYLWYLTEWFIKLFKYGKKSYKNLSFEREARFGDDDPDYLVTRKPYAWLLYL
jgi:hypothetical protein